MERADRQSKESERRPDWIGRARERLASLPRVPKLPPIARWAVLTSLFALAVWLCSRGLLWYRAVPFLGEPRQVTMPVEGLSPRAVHSTWHAARSGGRHHEGVDLFSPRGTPVVSATRGVVWKRGTNRLGGRVVTVLGDGPAFYYYAHLDGWADGLAVGDEVQPGTVLGAVGNSGNARTTPPHLHFGIYRIGLARTKPVDPAPWLEQRALAFTGATARQPPKKPTAPPPRRRERVPKGSRLMRLHAQDAVMELPAADGGRLRRANAVPGASRASRRGEPGAVPPSPRSLRQRDTPDWNPRAAAR